MIHKTLAALLPLLIITFLMSCQKEAVHLTENQSDQFTSLGHHNMKQNPGNGNGNGGGGENVEALYGAMYDGTFIIGEETIVDVEKNNGKFTSMDAMVCGSTELSGIDQLINCYTTINCSHFHEIRQFDKKSLPHRVATHFWLNDPNQGLVRFSMFGSIQAQINSDWTVLPVAGEDVDIIFDKWKLSGPTGCVQEPAVTFNPSLPNQHMTIRLIPESEVPSACNGVGLNCQ